MSLSEKLEQVRSRIEAACARAGRAPSSVKIMAAVKTRSPQEVREAFECGLEHFGENKVQEARAKIPLCPSGLHWHMIGHLQSNKVKDTARLFEMVHSVDSIKLLRALDAACGEAGKEMPVCLEVNVSGESAKFGFAPEDVPAALEAANGLLRVRVAGLMTMPPFNPEPEASRKWFRKLRELRDKWSAESGFELAELSMGMSDDFEVAVEEGATWVRLGTILFGPRRPARAAKPEEQMETP